MILSKNGYICMYQMQQFVLNPVYIIKYSKKSGEVIECSRNIRDGLARVKSTGQGTHKI